MKQLLYILTLVLVASCTSVAQTKKAQKLFDSGMSFFDSYDYENALAFFKQSAEKDPSYPDPHMMIGMVYVEQKRFQEAIESYKTAIQIDPFFFPNIYEELGQLNLMLGNYQEASKYFKIFLSEHNPEHKMRIRAENALDNCYFAMHAVKNPVPFEPENLGPNVNSEHHDFSPFVTLDNQWLYFSRTIPDPKAIDGRQEDFFRSRITPDGYGPAQNLGKPINSVVNEGAVAISPDGQYMIFTICDRFGNYGNNRSGVGTCDLFISKKQGENWSPARNLGRTINSAQWDGQGCLSSDGKTLYFASTRKGGIGGSDIYMAEMTDKGWTTPVNLGQGINTPGREMGVFIHPDNQTLYFSSNGHVGMGGYDIYVSRRNPDGTWGKPENTGYPINSNKDEMSVFINAEGKLAYITSSREGGVGSEDIYRFPVPSKIAPVPVTYMKGIVFDHETKENLDASFELIDVETGKVMVKSNSNSNTGEFMVTLPVGRNYALHVSKNGYLFHSEKFELTEGTNGKPYHKDVPLRPIKVNNEETALNNVFFNTDKYDLLPKSKAELDKLVDFLKNNPTLKIQINGHTDNQGSSSSNQVLSENRAKSVMTYLIEKGISKDRLSFVGYGDIKPIAENTTEEGRAKNRRTTFTIVEID